MLHKPEVRRAPPLLRKGSTPIRNDAESPLKLRCKLPIQIGNLKKPSPFNMSHPENVPGNIPGVEEHWKCVEILPRVEHLPGTGTQHTLHKFVAQVVRGDLCDKLESVLSRVQQALVDICERSGRPRLNGQKQTADRPWRSAVVSLLGAGW